MKFIFYLRSKEVKFSLILHILLRFGLNSLHTNVHNNSFQDYRYIEIRRNTSFSLLAGLLEFPSVFSTFIFLI
jgi:hypothetical protein